MGSSLAYLMQLERPSCPHKQQKKAPFAKKRRYFFSRLLKKYEIWASSFDRLRMRSGVGLILRQAHDEVG